MTPSLSQDQVNDAIGDFLTNILPGGTKIIVGQVNRVPSPKGDFVVLWPLRLTRLATNNEQQASLGVAATFMQPVQCVMQLDVHGPQAANNAVVISTIFRSSYAVDFFSANSPGIAPLFADDPRQMPFVTAAQQYEDRYIVEANLQVNQTVTATAQSARALELDITNVETDPTSWPNSVVTAP